MQKKNNIIGKDQDSWNVAGLAKAKMNTVPALDGLKYC